MPHGSESLTRVPNFTVKHPLMLAYERKRQGPAHTSPISAAISPLITMRH